MPDLVLCVADSTNLRLTIRLLLELKRTGRPMMLVLNMFDIATPPRHHRRRGAARRGARRARRHLDRGAQGRHRRLLRADRRDLGADVAAEPRENCWRALSVAELRATQREADRIIADCVSLPAGPTPGPRGSTPWCCIRSAGCAILALILFVMFQAVFAWAQPLMELLNDGFDALGEFVHDTLPAGLLQSFLQNGVISGVGSVIVFLPQIIIIFLFILLLEDFGYMARAAFLMDRIMGGAGLHGRAFIPLLSSFACAIPGIMATRVIDNSATG